jgi:hypothetical protein
VPGQRKKFNPQNGSGSHPKYNKKYGSQPRDRSDSPIATK